MAARRSAQRSAARSRPIAARTRRRSATPSTPTWSRAAASAATARRRSTFAIECAIDDLARQLGLDPFEIRRQQHGPARRLDRIGLEGSIRCRFRQLRSRPVPGSRRERADEGQRRARSPTGDEWAEGTGIALAMLDCGPPTEHRSGAEMALLPDGTLSPRGRLDRDGQWLGHLASPDRGLRCSARAPSSIDIINADTDLHALRHRHVRQHRHGRRRPGGGADGRGVARQHPGFCQPAHRADADANGRLERRRGRLRRAAHPARRAARRRHARPAIASRPSARPISRRAPSAFNVQGIALAVHRITGEIRILHSVHAADIGRLINPMQCRGQIDGAIAHGLRLGADREHGLRRATARW